MNSNQIEKSLISHLTNHAQSHELLEGYKFNSIQALVLEHGQLCNAMPLPKQYKPMSSKNCYKNAFKLMTKNKDLIYCEGFAIPFRGNFSLNHAWCITMCGDVIDPTWPYYPKGMAYRGIPFERDFVIETYKRTKCSLLDNWPELFPLLKDFKEEYRHYITQ